MKKTYLYLIPIYALVILALLLSIFIGNRVITVISQSSPVKPGYCFIIDAGHGGVDGGAVSCTGVYESHINLEIAIRLDDLMHLLGHPTKMIRTTDISIYTNGSSIAAKKSSDLKERVRIVNETEGAVLLSIHQNHFFDSYYSGGQIFYPKTQGSQKLANMLQTEFISNLNPGSNRKAKPAEGLYLMKHISKPGVLIECGFLSNYEEEYKLRTADYQKRICCVIVTTCGNYINEQEIA